MGRRLAPALFVLAFVFPASARADLISNHTVMGTGDLSPGVPGFSDTPFWWADTSGSIPGTALLDFGFYMAPGLAPYAANELGSLLLSAPFTLNDYDVLTVSLTVMTNLNLSMGHVDVGFAVLLEDSNMTAILANIRPDGSSHSINHSHPPNLDLTEPSLGVTTETTTGGMLPPMSLGTGTYGSPMLPEDCRWNCFTDITSTYAPGAGTYQLLFGVYSIHRGFDGTSALAVKSVTVPEPSSLALLAFTALGLTTLSISNHRRSSRAMPAR